MIFHDYFDYSIDKKERSFRPLPSGKLSKSTALLIAIVFLILANIFAFFIGSDTLLVSLILSSLVFFIISNLNHLHF